MMTHEERARFVRQQVELARVGAGRTGTGSDVAQAIVDRWEGDLNEFYVKFLHNDESAPKVTS